MAQERPDLGHPRQCDGGALCIHLEPAPHAHFHMVGHRLALRFCVPNRGPLSTLVSMLKTAVEARDGVIGPASVVFIGCDQLATEEPSPNVVSLYFSVTETHT